MATAEVIPESKIERPFDPHSDVSADAKYIVRQLVLWFLVFPPILLFLVWIVYNLIHAVTNSVR